MNPVEGDSKAHREKKLDRWKKGCIVRARGSIAIPEYPLPHFPDRTVSWRTRCFDLRSYRSPPSAMNNRLTGRLLGGTMARPSPTVKCWNVLKWPPRRPGLVFTTTGLETDLRFPHYLPFDPLLETAARNQSRSPVEDPLFTRANQ